MAAINGTPSCMCPACTDDEERGCARTFLGPAGTSEQVQCGLHGGHDGSCDYFEAVHKGNDWTPENGRSTPCSNYTARSWSPGSEQPEDARCVNCNQSHGPAVGGSESRVAPGQPADGERSAPPTDLGLDSGSDRA